MVEVVCRAIGTFEGVSVGDLNSVSGKFLWNSHIEIINAYNLTFNFRNCNFRTWLLIHWCNKYLQSWI